jgi:ligand-binding sensor domain-containing protein
MKNHFLQYPFFALLTVLLCFTACGDQGKAGHTAKSDHEQKTTAYGLPKIPKPLGLNKNAGIGYGLQTKDGNLWFCSNGEGVYRYDGKTFTHFTVKDGLDNDIVYSILEDRQGNIWFGTKTGLNRYDGKTFTKISIMLNYGASFDSNHSQSHNPSIENGVWCMMQDKSGTIWFGTDDGVFCYKGSYFTRFLDNSNVSNNDSLKLKAIFSILEDKTGNIWFAACTSEGVSRFDGKSLTLMIPYNIIRRTDRIIEDRKGNLWFASVFTGVGRYDGKTFTKNVFNEKANFGPFTVLEDKSGNIWFTTQEGLSCYDGKTVRLFTEKDGVPQKDRIVPVLEDKSGNLWFSGMDMGLYCYDGKIFTKFSE